MKTSKPMKTSKQDIQDLLSQLAADIEEIKAMLSSDTAGTTASDGVAAGTDTAGEANAISNDVVIGNGSTTANADRIIAEINRLIEPIAQTCGKLPDRIKSYHSQLLLHIVRDLREELTRDNDTRKHKGQPTVEDKIDNSLTILISIYDRLNQLEDAMLPNRPNKGQLVRGQASSGMSVLGKDGRGTSVHGESSKSGIKPALKSAWSGVRRFLSTRPARWYRNPYILCAIVIYLLYFGLSIFSWQQRHHYRDENTRLRLTADKYRVDSIILRKLYPQAAITLSAYEYVVESAGADTAIEVFRKDINAINSKSQ